MRLLITGASGYVGQEFLRSCPGDWETTCLGRSKVANCTRWIKCNLSDKEDVRVATRLVKSDFDVIIHLAAYVPKITEQDLLQESIDMNIMGTANLLQFFGGMSPKLVLGSTAEVYDQNLIDGKINELNSVGPWSYYASTKLSSEFIAESYAKKNSVGITILRFSVMYGGKDSIARALPNFIHAARRGHTIHVTNPDTLRDYIHLDDVIQSIFDAIEHPACGVVNIGSGEGTSIKSAAHYVIEATNSTSEVEFATADNKGFDIVMDITKAKESLRFSPQILFPQKLKDMVESYIE